MKSLTIGKVARRAGVGVETVRFYERKGLIDKPPRRQSGYRQYPEETVSRLRFIKRAKGLGFTLKEINELLSLRLGPETTCEDIRKRAESKIKDMGKKIETLREMKEPLTKRTLACRGHGPVDECPILAGMEEKNLDGGILMNSKRKIEVFSAGCSVCEETVLLVKRIACSSCEVRVLDMHKAHVAERAKKLGIHSVPAVAIDGKPADCCAGRGPDEATLRAAGLGQPRG